MIGGRKIRTLSLVVVLGPLLFVGAALPQGLSSRQDSTPPYAPAKTDGAGLLRRNRKPVGTQAEKRT
jgi:hypothetical protein